VSERRPDGKPSDEAPSATSEGDGTAVPQTGPGRVVRRPAGTRERRREVAPLYPGPQQQRDRNAGRPAEDRPRSGPPRSGPPRSGPPRSGPPRGGPGVGAGAKPGAGPKRRKRPGDDDPEREARRAKAHTLAKEKGIPLAHAHRIVQGRATLNEVLKALMRQERFERLVKHDGLDPSLAGQVASGHLSKERAQVVTKIRRFRKYPLDHDALKVGELDKGKVLIGLFERGWLVGTITVARVYDFDFVADGASEPETLLKHNVKLVAAAGDADIVRAAMGADEAIKAAGLAATIDRTERVRPSDDRLLSVVEADKPIALTLRDGDVIRGEIVSFGRWDVALQVGEGEHRPVVQVLFHALHQSSEPRSPGDSPPAS
jgi:hypothetical protein